MERAEATGVRRRYLVEGEVQGVGFRFFVVRQADRCGVRGWVRNLREGSVEALGAGSPEALAQFEAALRRGPPLARVERVRVEELPEDSALEALSSFEIR